jgi:uncharacterized membrane protein YvbJ
VFCPHCSHKNPPEAVFCAKCGGSLQLKSQNHKNSENPTVSEAMKWGMLIATIFIPIIGIVAGILYMQDSNLEKKSVGKLWLYAGLIMIFIYTLKMFGA